MRYTGFFPCSRLPIPDSRLPITDYLLPITYSLKPKNLYIT
ncbi:hypothetical protein [Moorena producens]|nr:hypothetical protein [Moorena producens]